MAWARALLVSFAAGAALGAAAVPASAKISAMSGAYDGRTRTAPSVEQPSQPKPARPKKKRAQRR